MTADAEWVKNLQHLLGGASSIVKPRGITTMEYIAMKSTIHMSHPVVTNLGRKISHKFMMAEAAWILLGSNRVSELVPYAPSMSKFSDDGVRLQGAYGVMFTEQVRYVKETILQDPDTRQAVMTFWRPNPRPSKDIPCTVSLQFLIRSGTIHCVATMRSSDTWLGWPYDVFSFTMITAYVALSCWKTLKLGYLVLTAGSQHLYEKDWEAAKGCISSEIRNYSPISLDIFNSPDHLVQCLCAHRDGRISLLDKPFLLELCQRPCHRPDDSY